MMTKSSKLIRLALCLAALLCLGSSAMAGPEPMYVMINGNMMKVVPMTKDVTLKNGCKVCKVGVFTDANGKTLFLKDGDVISTDGKLMKSHATKAHGG
jgi:hypothetical protein